MSLTLLTKLKKHERENSPPVVTEEMFSVASQLSLDVNILQKNMNGGFGSVFIAEDHGLSRRVAIKILYKDWKPERMRRESVALRRFCSSQSLHPHLITIYSCFETDHYFCYTMECADNCAPVGEEYRPDTLSWRIGKSMEEKAQPPTLEEIADLFHQLLDALEFLHSQGLVHLDIKPENILFVNGKLKLADYSLITGMDEIRKEFCGTSGFVPPNQRHDVNGGLDGVDQDLYAAGVVLHCFAENSLTWDGVSPFSKELQSKQFYKKLNRFLLKVCNACETERLHSVAEVRQGFNACFPKKKPWFRIFTFGVIAVLLLAVISVQAIDAIFSWMLGGMSQPGGDSDQVVNMAEAMSKGWDKDMARLTSETYLGRRTKESYREISLDILPELGTTAQNFEERESPYVSKVANGVALHLKAGQAIELPINMELPKWFEFAFFASGNIPCQVKVRLKKMRDVGAGEDIWNLETAVRETPFMMVFRVICRDGVLSFIVDGKEIGQQPAPNGGADSLLVLNFSSGKDGDVPLTFFKIWNLSSE